MREEVLHRRLVTYLLENKAYRNPDLRLKEIAGYLQTNTTYLSSLINQRYKMNFKTLLNRIRLEEAKQIMKERTYEYFSIEKIYKSVGFRSKSVFNIVFKAETGMTPSEYRARIFDGPVNCICNLPDDFNPFPLDKLLLV